jgi:hypothetical protein
MSLHDIETYITRTNLYTGGGEFVLPNGKDYVGYYHIHPEKGFMVGATHVDEFHEILIPTKNEEPPTVSSVELVSNFTYDEYSAKDLKLISPVTTSISEFRPSIDRVEFSIYNEQGLLDNINYTYEHYSILSGYNPSTGIVSTIDLDPGVDLIREGYTQGFYQVIYNFLRDKANSTPKAEYYISQISADRTELRLASNVLSNEQIADSTNAFVDELNSSKFFEDFYLNFGNNNLITGIRIALDDETNEEQFSIIIKLYEALPSQFGLKDSLWLCLQTAEAVSFDVEFTPRVSKPTPPKSIKGPNFNIQEKDIVNNSTVFKTAGELINTVLTSSYNELQNVLNKKGANISIDYEDFNNFVYFSSAQSRLENFYYKVKEIEDIQDEVNTIGGLNSQTTSTSSSIAILENKITNIIANFDAYENFLYYTTGSDWIWPKSNSTIPYVLESTSSAVVTAWYGSANGINPTGVLGSASLYDVDNTDRLVNSLPMYVQDNPVNQPFFDFMDMIGQHFDVFWTYTKAVGDRYDADNRLNYGVSKDIVADAIRSMGVTLYQNNFSSDDLSAAFLGVNASGNLLPPTGSEVIENYITASSDITKLDDVNKETYKRIFHNLPFLLKQKGTVTGLRTLINTYGIPDTILRISEFGGKDIDNTNDWDYYQSKFSYAAYNSGSSTTSLISSSFKLNSQWDENGNSISPTSVLLRFKPANVLPSSNEYAIVFKLDGSTDGHLTLTYTGSAYSSGSYSGSIPSASNEYATLTYWAGAGTKIIETEAPFYDGNWWGVQLSRTSGSSTQTYTLRTANNIYDGGDGFKIGYTSSVTGASSNTVWTNAIDFTLGNKNGSGVTINSKTYKGLTGSFQELRFYNTVLGEETFHDFVMNPYSIEGTDYSSSANNLAFRAPLGSNLNTNVGTLTSTHPKITGSSITNSFASNSTYKIESAITFPANTEFIYYDQPAVGIKNRISEKVRIADLVVASGNTLTPYRTIQQRYANSESYTRDINYLEVAFSPQNEINDDINSSFGYFNIGEYIGDPSITSQSVNSYTELDNLRDTYFEKYYKAYDWRDYIRLIKYFDNSLFKMLKDFVPSKTSISTGVVIKQHLLERNRQRPVFVNDIGYQTNIGYLGELDVYYTSSIEGGAGGIFDTYNYSGSGQEWAYTIDTVSGSLVVTQSTQDEFYNGELKGTEFSASNGEVGPPRLMASGSQFFTGGEVPKDYVDPLLNLVQDQVISSIYYKLEFNDSIIVASNLNLITGSSPYTKAEISDDLASRRAWTTSRYTGTRISSLNINQTFD